MEAYKKWVRRNSKYINSLNSLTSGVSWLLPETLSGSEIGPEAVSTVLGIIAAINGHIIDTAPTQKRTSCLEPCSSPYPFCISMIKEVETLVEVAAEERFGNDRKWNFIALLEATKVLFRLVVFRNSGYRMLLQGGETPNVEEKPSDVSSPSKPCNGNGKMDGRSSPSKEVAVGGQLPTLSKILLERGVSGMVLFVLGETLSISRPLIYVLLVKRYGVGSWVPWFVSLAVDFVGVGCLTPLSKLRFGEQQNHFSDPEQHEVKRRKLLWALYLMRDPFFNKYARQRLESSGKIVEEVPLVGILTGKLVELVLGVQSRYSYTSSS